MFIKLSFLLSLHADRAPQLKRSVGPLSEFCRMPHRPKLIVALINVLLIVVSLVVAKGRAPTPNNDVKAIIDVCKLVKDPSQYAGKTIRLKAVLVENRTSRVDGGDPYLYGPGCRRSSFSVVVEFSSEESYQPVERVKPDVHGDVRLNVILVGIFRYSRTQKYGHLDWADSQFLVHRVEKIKAL